MPGPEQLRRHLQNLVLVLVAAFVMLISSGPVSALSRVTDTERSASRAAIAQALGPGRSYALVLGVSTFDDPAWPTLNGVDDEVAKVTAALAAQAFTIAPESRSGRFTHAELAQALSRFFATYGAKAENRLIVYIATHGYADATQPGADGFLVVSDAGAPRDGRVPNGYSVTELSATLTSVAAQHVFLFFNSCFSGAMLPEPTRAFDPVAARKPLAALSRETVDWTTHLLNLNARLVLTAGDATETVPDRQSPFADAVVAALGGDADADGDGLTLGTEIAQFVRSRVARASRAMGHPNDPVFAVLPKLVPPHAARPDAPPDIDYKLQGDFVFLTPGGPQSLTETGQTVQEAELADRRSRLASDQFLACIDCPTMVRVPGAEFALGATEITYGQWEACYRQMGCHRFLADDGQGRGDRPAANLTWLDALEYLAWVGSAASADSPCTDWRLPTRGEWLAAALYTPSGPVTWDVAVADTAAVCWGCGVGLDGVAAMRTASLPANPAGLYDMIGNVWEWVDDDRLCTLTSLRQSGGCSPGRVMGGSFATMAGSLPAIAAGGEAPRTANTTPWSSPTIGMRLACDLKP